MIQGNRFVLSRKYYIGWSDVRDRKDRREREMNLNVAFTHSGKFHADDVFGAALLTYINPEIKILRGHEVPEGFDGIVFDIGGGEFDHHQPDRRERENEVAYAAFGLLWEKFGPELVGQEEAERFDRDFVQPMDITDNTGTFNQLATAIGYFNPPWDSEQDENEAFEEAKQFALAILTKKIELIKSVGRAEGMVREALAEMKDDILILPKSAPWRKVVKETSTEFVIFPSDRGGYCAQTVYAEKETTEDGKPNYKVEFPKSWAGLRDAEVEAVSGIPGLRFCHNARFLIAADTIEAAVQACKQAQAELKAMTEVESHNQDQQ